MTFNTPLGHFEYLILLFSLTKAPTGFQALVNKLCQLPMVVTHHISPSDPLSFDPQLTSSSCVHSLPLTLSINCCHMAETLPLSSCFVVRSWALSASPACPPPALETSSLSLEKLSLLCTTQPLTPSALSPS